MDQLLSWGLDVVRAVQTLASPALTLVMKGLSLAGTEYCYLILLTFIYWCVDKRRALRMSVLVFLSTAINLRLKLAFVQPRPYDLDPSVGMIEEVTYGLPSAHSQTSAVFGGSAAPLFRPPWGLVVALVLPLLVGLSRIYLGAHFPTDVLAGWAIGAAIVCIDRRFGDGLERLVDALRESIALALVTAIALFMNVLTQNDTSLSGTFFGLAGAAIYAKKIAPFSVAGSPGKRALRYLLGLGSTIIVYILPKLLLAEMEAAGPPLVRFMRYATLGAWVALGAPWLFLKTGLAESEPYSAKENEGSVISK